MEKYSILCSYPRVLLPGVKGMDKVEPAVAHGRVGGENSSRFRSYLRVYHGPTTGMDTPITHILRGHKVRSRPVTVKINNIINLVACPHPMPKSKVSEFKERNLCHI